MTAEVRKADYDETDLTVSTTAVHVLNRESIPQAVERLRVLVPRTARMFWMLADFAGMAADTRTRPREARSAMT